MYPYRQEPKPTPAAWDEDAFHLFSRIDSVVILVRDGRDIHAIEHNHAGRLLRQLDKFGRDGVSVLGMLTREGALDRSSIRALNCCLRYGPGLDAFRRSPGFFRCRHPFHRFGWVEFKRYVGLRFVS